jgi:hypothetical protein
MRIILIFIYLFNMINIRIRYTNPALEHIREIGDEKHLLIRMAGTNICPRINSRLGQSDLSLG